MKQIDWSQAPEWANVYLRNIYDCSLFAWAEAYQQNARFQRDDSEYNFKALSVDCWTQIAMRPATPQWNGEGLPPVGVVCEAFYDDGRVCWHEAEVIHHRPDDHRVAAVILRGTHHDRLTWLNSFRLIRTPEQIAAEEREAACEEMLEIAKSRRTDPDVYEAIATLYDAGYRKPNA